MSLSPNGRQNKLTVDDNDVDGHVEVKNALIGEESTISVWLIRKNLKAFALLENFL